MRAYVYARGTSRVIPDDRTDSIRARRPGIVRFEIRRERSNGSRPGFIGGYTRSPRRADTRASVFVVHRFGICRSVSEVDAGDCQREFLS